MRNIFGWSLPPGCRTLPGEEPTPPCEVCGGDPEGDVDNGCICPECECGETGNPDCYERHRLVRTPEQIEGRAEMERAIAADAESFGQMESE